MPLAARSARPQFSRANKIIALAIAAVPFSLCRSASADKYWINSATNGTWSNGADWNATSPAGPGGAGAPVATDNVYIQNSTSSSYTTTLLTTQAAGFTINSLHLGSIGGGVNNLEQTGGGSLTILTSAYIGSGAGYGNYEQNAGTLTIDSNLYLGASTEGVLGLSGYATTIVNGNAYLGGNATAPGGTGSLNITGGTGSDCTFYDHGTLKTWTYGAVVVQSGGNLVANYLDNAGVLDVFNSNVTVGSGSGTAAISNTGTILLHNATINFLGSAYLPGTVISDPSTVTFSAGVTIPSTGLVELGTGDKWVIAGGSFENDSTNTTSTFAGATLAFTGSGNQTLTLGSAQAASQTWGTLDLGANTNLTVTGTGSLQVNDLIVEGNTAPNLTNIDLINNFSITGAQSISADAYNYAGYETTWTDTGVPANDGDFVFSNNAIYHNEGTFIAENDRSFTGAGTFYNEGTFRKQITTGTTVFALPFDNLGTVQAYSGTIQFAADGTDSYPTYFAAAGATIDFHAGNRSGVEYSPTIFTGTGGNIDISGGTFTTYSLALAPNVGDSINVSVSAGTHSLGGIHIGANQFNTPGGVATLSISGSATANVSAITLYNGSIQQSGGTVTTGALYVDTNPATPQTSTLSAGTFSCGTYSTYGFGLLLGNSTTTEGRIELTGSASLSSQGSEAVGYTGYGRIQQDGGTNVAGGGGIAIADEPGSSGGYVMNAGSLETTALYVGANGNGSFALTGGMAEVLTDFHVGNSTGSNGTFTLSGGTLQVDESEYIAQAFTDNDAGQQAYGSGTFIQNGGYHSIPNQQLQIGEQTGGGAGSYTMNGGTLIVGNGVYVGPNGTFNLNHGDANLNGSLPTTGGYADLGVAGTFTIANNADASLTINHFEYIYNFGPTPATFHQYGGTQTIAGYLIAGRTTGSSGQYILDNGYASAKNVYIAGDQGISGGNATFTINGGEFDVGKEATANVYDGDVHVYANGTVILNGGTLAMGSFHNDGRILLNGGTYNLPTGTDIESSATGSIILGSGTGPAGTPPPGGITRALRPADTSTVTWNIGANTTLNNQIISLGTGVTATAATNLTLGGGTAGAQTMLNISGGSTTINGTLGVGNSGTVTTGNGSSAINISNGALYAGTILEGNTHGGDGTVTISGSGVVTVGGGLNVNDCNVEGGTLSVLNQAPPVGEDPELNRAMVGGYLRDGALNVSGGYVSTPNLKLGITSGNTGSFTQTGGTVNVGVLGVGNDATETGGNGTGIANISAGTLNANTILLGDTAGGSGAMTVSGTGVVTVAGGLNMNDLTVNGGTVTVMDGAPPAGEDPELADAMVGGYLHNGALIINGGGVSSPFLKLGITAGNTGTFTQVAGSASLAIMSVGCDGTLTSGSGTGIANVSGGTLFTDTLYLGDTNGGSGQMNVSGNANVTVGGTAHLNDLNISGGTFTVLDQDPPAWEDPEGNRAIIGGYITNGELNVSGGYASTPYLKLGITAGKTGTFNQTGGVVTVGTLCLGSDNTQASGAGVGSATVSGGTLSIGTLLISSTAGGIGTLAISGAANVTIGGVNNSGLLTQSGGTSNLGTIDGTGSFIASGGSPIVTHIRQSVLDIARNTTVTLASSPSGPGNPTGVSVVNDLSNNGTIDLRNNALIVNDPYQASSVMYALFNAYDNGNWDKPGITSSSAAANAGTYSLGYLTGSDIANLGSTTFQGQPVTSNSTVVMYTLIGDTQLRGTVDGTDYNTILSNYDVSGTGWSQGNFYNESLTSGDDYNAVLNAYDVAASGGAKGLKPAITRSLSPALSPVATSGTFHLEVNTTSGDVTLFNDSTSSAPLTLYNIVDGSQQDLLIGNPADSNGTSGSIASGTPPYTNEHFLSVAGDDSNAVASISGRSSTNYKAWSLVLDGYNSNATALGLSEGGQANKTDTINVPSYYSIDLGDIFNVGTTTVALTFQWGTETSAGGEGGTVYSNQPIDYIGTPEPASLGLLGLGGLAMMRRRRKASSREIRMTKFEIRENCLVLK
jgi:hypothetical protein